jgi:uncharacterized metal-binding protein
MPQNKLHSKFNSFILLPLILAAAWFYVSKNIQVLGLLSACFLYATYFANPDADLANQQKLLTLKGIMLLPFKLFYAPFFRHRSRISHSLIWGTPTRLLAIFLFIILISFSGLMINKIIYGSLSINDFPKLLNDMWNMMKYSFMDIFNYAKNNKTFSLAIVSGFYFADFGHILLDRLSR